MTKERENDTKANEGYKGKLDMGSAYTKLRNTIYKHGMEGWDMGKIWPETDCKPFI